MAVRKEDFVPEPPHIQEPPRPRWTLWIAAGVVAIATGLTAASLTFWRGTPVPHPGELNNSYVSPVGFTMMYPGNWVVSRFEGHDQFRPVTLPSLEQGLPTFAIDVTTPDLTSGPDCAVQPGFVKIGGRPASGCEIPQPGGAVDAWYVATVGSPGVNLVMHVVGSTSDLWSQHIDTARAMLMTFQPIVEPAATHGTLVQGIPMNTYTHALIGFLEARVMGDGADYWMMENASGLYASHSEGLSLYADSTGIPWKSYSVTAYRGVDANSAEFDVTLHSSTMTFTETIGVGVGTNVAGISRPAVVRFAVKR